MSLNMTVPPAIQVGVWGIGEHATRTILPALSTCEMTHILAIGSRNSAVAEKHAKTLACRSTNGLDQLLDLEELDCVFVASPIDRHFEDGISVLEAGKHLWSEKTLCTSAEDALTLLEVAADSDLAICVSNPPLYHSQFGIMADLLTKNALGPIRTIHADFGFPHKDRENSRYKTGYGRGAIFDVGYYPLTIAASLFGDTPQIVGAVLESDEGFDVDTSGSALLRFADGMHLTASWGYGRDYINEIRITGEDAALLARPVFSKPPHLPVRLELIRENKHEEIAVCNKNQFVAMLEDFVKVTRDPAARNFRRLEAVTHQRLLNGVVDIAKLWG